MASWSHWHDLLGLLNRTEASLMLHLLLSKNENLNCLLWKTCLSYVVPKGMTYSAINIVNAASERAAQCEETGRTWLTDALAARWPCNPELEPRWCWPAATATERKPLLSIKTKAWIKTGELASQIWKRSVWLFLANWRDSYRFNDSQGFYNTKCRETHFTARVDLIWRLNHEKLWSYCILIQRWFINQAKWANKSHDYLT